MDKITFHCRHTNGAFNVEADNRDMAIIEARKVVAALGRPSELLSVSRPCAFSCGPSDFAPGGKCDRRGCYYASDL